MKISPATLELIAVLRDLVDGDDIARQLAGELSKLPDFETARATAGYYVTPDGDITDNHWWLVMDDDSVFDASGDVPVRCSKKDPRHKHYFPYNRDRSVPVEVLTLADHLKGSKRASLNKSFTEMAEAAGEAEGVSAQELAAVERYADRLFQKVGIDVAFSRHFIDRVNDPRNRPNISVAELVRLFKQQFRKHGKRIPRLGPDAEAVLQDMATDVNVPFVLKWDSRNGMLDLVSKTVMRKRGFGTSDPVFAVEDGKVAPSDAAQQASSMPGDVTAGGKPGVPQDDFDDETRPEDMQLGWEDLLDQEVKEVDHPEFMPGGEEDSGHDPTYDERQTQYNPGHPRP